MRKILYLIIAFLFCAECEEHSNRLEIKTDGRIFINSNGMREYIGDIKSVANHLYNHGHMIEQKEYQEIIAEKKDQRAKFNTIVDERLNAKKQALRDDTKFLDKQSENGMSHMVRKKIENIEKEKDSCRKRSKVTFFVFSGNKYNFVRDILKSGKIIERCRNSIILQINCSKSIISHLIGEETMDDFSTIQPMIKIILDKNGERNYIKTAFVLWGV